MRLSYRKQHTRIVILLSFLLITAGLFLLSCTSAELKSSKPIIPITEYERLLVGRLDADYVGTDRCLKTCHVHDQYRKDFEGSTMGAQLSPDSGLPLVDCETCHGPGSLAIEGITPERVAQDAAKGIVTECRHETFIQIDQLPQAARSLMCLRCHTANATFNLHQWNSGAQAVVDTTCTDCHNIHAGPDLVLGPHEVNDICLRCHQKTSMEFSMRSRHPIRENRMFCTDCHNPHGTVASGLLSEMTLKETCTKCHGEYGGPFAFEHADLGEDCSVCHEPHGSPFESLLKQRQPFLCMQCHEGHGTSSTSSAESRAAYYTRCTDCHSTIHGTDTPSPGGGRFTQ